MKQVSRGDATTEAVALVEKWSAHNYNPLPVVVAHAKGSWVTDVEGKQYLDMLSAYSALNFGHCHPRLLHAARTQLERVTLTSRAFHNEQLGPFCEALAKMCRMEAVLPMNSGAEAVETAVKLARRWAYDVKGVRKDNAKIIVCSDNFHGRTTTIVSFSTDESARKGFGPFTPGFEIIPFGDIEALRNAIDEDTVAFLIEPVQGEAGVVVPRPGFLSEARALCAERNVLFIADEVQAGLGRTGKLFACDHEGVTPDIFILGKALAGGFYPLSAVVSRWDIMGVIGAGEHGSTFGGNPLACAIGLEVLSLLGEGDVLSNGAAMGDLMLSTLRNANLANIKEVRGVGLWAGIELNGGPGSARKACEKLLDAGILAKDTHGTTVRFAPPLTISREDMDWALERMLTALA